MYTSRQNLSLSSARDHASLTISYTIVYASFLSYKNDETLSYKLSF